MSYQTLPADTCPLCQQRALHLAGTTCTCTHCGSEFALDPYTRRCRYTHLAPQYAALEKPLSDAWITRREVFGRVGQAREAGVIPLEPVITEPETAPGAAVEAPATMAAGTTEVVNAAPVVPGKPASTPGDATPRPPTPIAIVWAVLVGSLALIAILFACLAVLILGRDIPRTRSIIAAANMPTTVPVSATVAAVITATQGVSPLDSLNSPLATPTSEATTIAGLLTGTVETGQLPTPIPLEAATGQASDTTTPPAFFTPIATTVQPAAVAPTTQSTFTPRPITLPTRTLVPATSTATPTPSPSMTPSPTSTVAPSPTATLVPTYSPSISSSVVISTVMYNGDPNTNYSNQYIEIQNRGSVAINISGWSIRALQNQQRFYFTTGIVIQPGMSCRVYGNSPPSDTTGCGTYSYNSPSAILSTSHDRVELRDQNDNLIGVFTY